MTYRANLVATLVLLTVASFSAAGVWAQTAPTMLHPRLDVRPVVTGLTQPTTMAFLGPNDLLVLQKAAGLVRRVSLVGGVWTLQTNPLDLAVNNVGGRGLMGIAVHPNFATNSFVYLYWTESSTGADTNVAANTPLLGNRVDRFV